MSTYDYTIGSAVGMPNKGGSLITVQRLIDIAAIVAARAAADPVLAVLAQNDVLQVLPIPADVELLMVAVKVLTVEGEAMTIDIGDGSTAGGFISGADCNALGVTTSLITSIYSLATAGGKYYTAADTLDVTLKSNITYSAAKFFITALFADFRLLETQGT